MYFQEEKSVLMERCGSLMCLSKIAEALVNPTVEKPRDINRMTAADEEVDKCNGQFVPGLICHWAETEDIKLNIKEVLLSAEM